MISIQEPVQKDFLLILKALPGCHLFVLPDAPKFTIIEATEAYLQATLANRSIIGKGIFEAFPDNPSVADAASVNNLTDSLLWVAENKKTHHMPVQRYDVVNWRTGSFEFRIWKATNKPVIDVEGKLQYIIHTVEDITGQIQLGTSQAQVENKLEDASRELEHQKLLTNTILSASLNGIYALEAVRDEQGLITDYRYLFVNHAIANHLHKTIGEIIGARVSDLVPENTTNGFFDYFRSVLEKGQPDRQQTWFSSQSFSGWFDFTVIPVSKDVLIVTTQDITDIKESQLQLQQTVHELKRSNQSLEEFANAASHDLKEPVRKIHFYTQKLKDQLGNSLKENEVASFSKIEGATDRMVKLIDDLLLYSYVSVRPQQKENVDLNETIRQVLEDLDLEIQQKNAHIHIEPLPQLPGNNRQLQQLFQNLISNALKYCRAGMEPELTITATINDSKGRPYHVVEVSDKGIGFEQEYSEKIFEMFARLHRKNEYSGTGVGLSIVRKVAENHDGFVKAIGEPGKGSRFQVYLPA